MKNIMTHVVAGYPSVDECIELMLGMQQRGVELIEVQIPFSDPIADGETIMLANDVALRNGMTTDKSFQLIKQARDKGLTSKIYLMSYVQKLVHFGISDFCKQATKVGVAGLIVPDLPFDTDEYYELSKVAKENSLEIVPVVSPEMDKQRLRGALANAGKLVYLTSTKGITGNRLLVSDTLGELVQSVRKLAPNSDLAVGFGVQSKKDVEQIMEIADIAVVGSSVIRRIDESGVDAGLEFIQDLTA